MNAGIWAARLAPGARALSAEPFRIAQGGTMPSVSREGTLVYDLDLSGPLVFVLGAEGTGVPDEIAARADRRVRVPMRARVESLNVGVAGAILVYEAARQRGTIS